MPPKPKASAESLKQKSLMSFFSKGPATTSKATPKLKTPATKNSSTAKDTGSTSNTKQDASKPRKTAPESSPLQPKTPNIKSLSTKALTSSVGPSSPTSSRGVSTPPTSDPIDVDMDIMASSEPEEERATSRPKRKAVVVDSDDEDDEAPIRPAGRSRLSRHRGSSPTEAASRKKARLSEGLSDDEEDEEDLPLKSFTQRLSRFKKSPKKKKSASRKHSDDEDFIAKSDESEEELMAKSVKSSSSRRSSIASTDLTDLDLDDEEEDEPKPSKSKKAGAKSSAPKQLTQTTSTGGGSSFLTAAEQRALDKKDGKKKAENPFAFLQDIRDIDGRRPGDEGYDLRTLHIPSKAWKEFTPFEKQFWEIKQKHYDTVLFFQKGCLYEDDARIGHQEFDLKLTSRVKMSMVGVPEMAFDFWAAKFLGKGYKVGRVEQAETALGAEMRMAADKGKGKVSADKEKEKIVRRELNKVYTNGTLVDPALLTDENAGHCVCICEESAEDGSDSANKFGICVLDCSTSQFNLTGFVDDICRTKLETLLRQICPKEFLFTKGSLSVDTQRILKSILPSSCLWTALRDVEGFKYDAALNELKTLFPNSEGEDAMEEDSEGEGGSANILPPSVPQSIREMAHDRPAMEALGSMIWYLRQLNIDKDIISMRNFNIYDPMKRGQNLTLDGQTLAHLELLGTLLSLLQRCVTPSGKRLFRMWLCMPLREVSAINARLDAVEDIIEHPTFEATFSKFVKGLPDLERVVSRIHAKSCKVKDFLKVLKAFKTLSKGLAECANESEGFDSRTISGLLRGAPDLLGHIKNLEAMFQSPEENEEIRDLEKLLENEIKGFRKSTGLELNWWHSAIGNKDIYLIETTAAKAKNVPSSWTKSSSTKAKVRFVVPALQKPVRKLKEARETRNGVIKTFKFRLFEEFSKDRAVWLRAIRVLSELDCLFSLAKSSTAIGTPSCRPEFVEGEKAFMEFEELRHPTVCLNPNITSFVDNNVSMGGESAGIVLLTGPNMAMTATGVIMAQLGMLVPASRARLCPIDAIITRMGAYDNMFSNASTFKVELDECCKILRDATPRSLVILDELGRGTSTFDGMAIAGAVLHELATHTLPLAFFATHYGSLTDDYAYHPNISRMFMATEVDDEAHELTFLYKLVKGVAESSFGTHVANLAGVPTKVVQRADVISKEFAKQFKARIETKHAMDAASKLPVVAQADFAYLFKLAAGAIEPPADPVRKREVLKGLKAAIRGYLPPVSA
ncbi:DNA mismatch repair protein msh6 [Ephemerocybe angulata]|uniref:DNA mismatch repair protein n=1 Tax=Ephemerocybe angulata TaxID=980116 RepID=A0A8H6IFK1_9AGAR|nr:DNA mismatch repair protein msh6 [Tulosesus angulatus]